MRNPFSRSFATLAIAGGLAVAASGLSGTTAAARQEGPDIEKLANVYSQAWAKADAAALAALHTADAIRIAPDGSVAVGRAAIQKNLAETVTGSFKGTTLAITRGQLKRVTDDVYVGEGTYKVTGGSPPAGTPTSGRYLNTVVRQGGNWLIASNAAIPDQPKM